MGRRISERLVSAAAVLMLGGGGAMAAPLRYDCQLNGRPARSFMSPTLSIVLFDRTDRANVLDGIIWKAKHRWIPAHVQVDNPRRATLVWVVNGVPARHASKYTTVSVRETATLIKGAGRIQLSQQALGADNSFSAAGTCTARVPPFMEKRGARRG
ncbi:hypothetical protein [Acidimangrovimonas sediminis]|uniref:hypothetical protein n=1 Tax=Acidimangrovimonas sediminis TaxID=2056283 RepID=UPI000C80ECFD|nr:hypothetical protein [Acidimangrovimonas sediminis]